MLRVLVMVSILFVGACSMKLGAEKLELDAKAASKVQKQPDALSVRADSSLVQRVLV